MKAQTRKRVLAACCFLPSFAAVAAPTYFSEAACDGDRIGVCATVGGGSSVGTLPGTIFSTQVGDATNYASASVRSGPGDLGAEVHTRIQGVNVPPPINASNRALAAARYVDTIAVESGSLGTGAAVALATRHVLDASIFSFSSHPDLGNPATIGYAGIEVWYTMIALDAFGSATMVISDYSCFGTRRSGPACTAASGDLDIHFDDLLYAQVGGSIVIEAIMQAWSESVFYTAGPVFSGSAQGDVDAMNSLHAYLAPLNEEVILVSESGHDYAFATATVAEPGAPLLLLAGLAILPAFRRARART